MKRSLIYGIIVSIGLSVVGLFFSASLMLIIPMVLGFWTTYGFVGTKSSPFKFVFFPACLILSILLIIPFMYEGGESERFYTKPAWMRWYQYPGFRMYCLIAVLVAAFSGLICYTVRRGEGPDPD